MCVLVVKDANSSYTVRYLLNIQNKTTYIQYEEVRWAIYCPDFLALLGVRGGSNSGTLAGMRSTPPVQEHEEGRGWVPHDCTWMNIVLHIQVIGQGGSVVKNVLFLQEHSSEEVRLRWVAWW